MECKQLYYVPQYGWNVLSDMQESKLNNLPLFVWGWWLEDEISLVAITMKLTNVTSSLRFFNKLSKVCLEKKIIR